MPILVFLLKNNADNQIYSFIFYTGLVFKIIGDELMRCHLDFEIQTKVMSSQNSGA